jgi:hypothetical protein
LMMPLCSFHQPPGNSPSDVRTFISVLFSRTVNVCQLRNVEVPMQNINKLCQYLGWSLVDKRFCVLHLDWPEHYLCLWCLCVYCNFCFAFDQSIPVLKCETLWGSFGPSSVEVETLLLFIWVYFKLLAMERTLTQQLTVLIPLCSHTGPSIIFFRRSVPHHVHSLR